jgi:hypothetical protein
MPDHTVGSIKSMEGFKIAWVEGAQTRSYRSPVVVAPDESRRRR